MPERCSAALSYEQSIRERLNETGESIGNEFSRLAQKAGIFRAEISSEAAKPTIELL